ncbi:hypothetical protein [Enterococcus thailandicus]|uniref:hypothetical protein n=1 Tax=Enterococcus thailandicus TaxID=417368 RepID=UPI0022EBF3D2|nr:hypothetical protein [Enterococcus thailandicus]MDA3965959.1 hypothetical protein [Enterococcus thailandicus]
MKKAKWIFSVNADGVPPLGYMGTKAGQYLFGNGMKFQKELKADVYWTFVFPFDWKKSKIKKIL